MKRTIPDKAQLLIGASAQGIQAWQCEYDYWFTYLIKELNSSPLDIIYKGSTVLCKIMDLVPRLPRDLDILILPSSDSYRSDLLDESQQRKKYFTQLKELLAFPELSDPVMVLEDSQYRQVQYQFRYPSYFQGADGGVLTLELSLYQGEPWEKYSLKGPFDIEAMSIACYNHEQSFLDKINIISHRYHLLAQGHKWPSPFIHHYYDLWFLLQNPVYRKLLDQPSARSYLDSLFKGKYPLELNKNPAFMLWPFDLMDKAVTWWQEASPLYLHEIPDFWELIGQISQWLGPASQLD
ncbi:nucleotidyl transferase AbiEii/AbiGii toxin family protein [Spirochaeta cellobiosiphila]|uniref:nucleotidyl transferase AbiEii/AbiGii toxin family protein n=1 Tax=Spirochaeta cellobiosiphila TaxID=504483 RepID=UPI000422176E|nr:nucleotidyl transferase AbiEii/AbiGii toxin family protein [Spirochaeta cellobiosiphila]